MAGKDNLGFGTKFAYAEVIDVKDKDRAGYYRLRVHGKQEDLQDKDLAWGRMMTHGASHQKIGKSPTRLIKGSHVMCMYEDPGENMIILGAVDRSGTSSDGVTIDGRQVLYPTFNSLPNVCYGNNEEVGENDLNALGNGRPPDSYAQTADVLLEQPSPKKETA